MMQDVWEHMQCKAAHAWQRYMLCCPEAEVEEVWKAAADGLKHVQSATTVQDHFTTWVLAATACEASRHCCCLQAVYGLNPKPYHMPTAADWDQGLTLLSDVVRRSMKVKACCTLCKLKC